MSKSSSENDDGTITRNLRRIQSGEDSPSAYEAIYKQYRKTVLRQARRRVRQLAVVDESDVAIGVWDSIFRGLVDGKHQCSDRTELEELIGQITYHKAIKLYRWVKRARRHPSIKMTDQETLESKPLKDELRQVADLHFLRGQSIEEIAESLTIELSTVQLQVGEIRRWLQENRYRPTAFHSSEILEWCEVMEGPLGEMLFEELLASLDGRLRQITLLKLEGKENSEIAEEIGTTVRQVQRQLKLLRDILRADANH